ncbi:porin [Flavobacteriaceae bacterium TP-CH-4]|uniref:Porin n=1 Tax=Pelagihabitans pacificus TaxID=2696054 RepID=A0A967APK6_9FLAO|nr:outer membrane beta-barrel protein [Pelagihabitans pacificus]NHF57909.1 porin [Pelagihabitans pacificus]
MKTITITKFVKNSFTLALMLLVATFSFAQEEEEEKKKFTFGGSIDAYYKTNLNAPNDEGVAPLTSFANLDGFALGMANIIASYETGKVGAVADLVFGPRGTDAIFNSPQYSLTGNVINQLYAYWNVSDKVTLTFGNFNTFLGYEVISPTGNFNYSTSHLFSFGPFSHTGLKADFALSDDFSLMLAVMNPTDLTEFNSSDGKYAFGAQLGYSGQYLNLLLDDAGLGFEVDYTGGFDLSEKFFLGINGAYQTNTFDDEGTEITAGFYGAALYPQLAASDSFSIGLRGEYFGFHSDVDGVDTPSVFAATLTGSYSIDDLTIKPEIRLDTWTDNEPFIDSDGLPQDNLAVFYLAAIYSF